MYSYSQWLEDYRARWRSIVILANDIPLVDGQAIEDMVSYRWCLHWLGALTIYVIHPGGNYRWEYSMLQLVRMQN